MGQGGKVRLQAGRKIRVRIHGEGPESRRTGIWEGNKKENIYVIRGVRKSSILGKENYCSSIVSLENSCLITRKNVFAEDGCGVIRR